MVIYGVLYVFYMYVRLFFEGNIENAKFAFHYIYDFMKKILLFACACFYCVMSFGQIKTDDIKNLIKGKEAVVGMAVIYDDKCFTVRNRNDYPLMSLFKLHVSVAALNKMERENISLDSLTYIEPTQMDEDTYSPLRDKYPNQRIRISYRDIIGYTMSQSDNNTCDWLINFVGGIQQVDAYIKSLGIKGVKLNETERSMHEDIFNSYNNRATPLSVTQLLQAVEAGNILTAENTAFLRQTMLDCSTGTDKLIAGLPVNVRFGHKTGHSDRKPDGTQIATTDAGIIYLPNGKKCFIAVLIKDSKESDEENARIMSSIARVVYDNIISQNDSL